jgi:hypothetical protein
MKDNPLVQAIQQHQQQHVGQPGGQPGAQVNPLLGQQGPGAPRR